MTTKDSLTVRTLTPEPLSRDAFAPFGELIEPSGYGKPFDDQDARLDLSGGTPRLYIMRSPHHGMEFERITRPRKVTQCLGARNDRDWVIAVAPPDDARDAPDASRLKAFRIPGETTIKLHLGTWHAGPYFTWDYVDFFNLELADTNQTDSEHYSFADSHGCIYRFDIG
ncbi:MAG: ureidoglycolate lyase [Ectothiorhodospiraceae bacterium]|nr:ureidoglycolate lyase [Ectothiorhodospiraceae bacterium]